MTAETDIVERAHAERLIAMQRSQFSLREILSKPIEGMPEAKTERPVTDETANGQAEQPSPAATADELTALPGPGEPYTAHARPSNKPVPTLHLLLADASARGFAYANMDTLDLVPASEPGQGPVIVLQFNGLVPKEVRITGRNLDTLYSYLGLHRVMWLKQRPPSRDFIPENETVVTGITVRKVEA